LPRNPNVVELLNEFASYVAETNPPRLQDPKMLLPTIISGLVLYFERSLGANLLYRFERPQLADVKKKYRTGQEVKPGQEKEVSAVYGAEHLLRLLVSLPAKIAQSSWDPESVSLVRDYVNELLQWMANEKQRIFQHDYENATSVYISLAAS
jgi:mortality factor 4-like protein 1